MRQVLETGRRREDQAALIAQLLERGVDELRGLARRLDPRVAGIDDAERHRALPRTETLDGLRRGLAAPHVDPEDADRRHVELLDDLVDREEVRVERHGDAALGEPRESGALQIDELGMRGERRLLDVDDLRARRRQARELLRERIGNGQRACLKGLVVMVLGGERRERERSAYRSLQVRPAAQLAVGELEVADERLAVRFDRARDDRLPEVRVVVVETLERPALTVAPGLREWREQVVPADLTVVDHV